MTLTAKVPFDDRVCHQAELDDLKLPLIRSFLREVRSDLYARAARVPLLSVARQMALVDGPDEYAKPRNVGLLFFNESPERFFPGTQIDLVLFPQGVGGSELVEQTFRGPLHTQIRDCLGRLRNVPARAAGRPADRRPPLPQPPDRGLPEGAGADRGPLDRHPEDPPGHAAERLAGPGLRHGRRPDVLPRPAADSPGVRPGGRRGPS
jgi:hypothetical protein